MSTFAYLKGVDESRIPSIPLKPSEKVIIGRKPHCELVVSHKAISGEHASFWCDTSDPTGRSYMIENMGTSGTFVNDVRLSKPGVQFSIKVRSRHSENIQYIRSFPDDLVNAYTSENGYYFYFGGCLSPISGWRLGFPRLPLPFCQNISGTREMPEGGA